jgi:lipid-A-disaccharide synthase
MAQKQILIICGEPSGELHAANLTSSIRKIDPHIKVFGVGSTLLANAGAEIIYNTKGLSVFGLFDVIKKLPWFWALKEHILEKIAQHKFDAVIFVDFSGFNLRLAKTINNSIPTIYYVSPQVWASRPGRIKTIKKYIRKMIVLFKFEVDFYKKYGITAEFVGHPLLDTVKPTMAKKDLLHSLGLNEDRKIIALLPGSRRQEIKHILPIMLKASRIIKRESEAQFVIAKSPNVEWDTYTSLINKSGLDIKITEGKTYDCLNIADFALVCSGTATLETAIMQKPFVIIYKMSLLNYLLYRPQVRLPYIGMVNIVAGKKVIPEFIQFNANPRRIAQQTLSALKDPVKIQQIKDDLASITHSLGDPQAAGRAARIILDFLK